MVVKCPRTPKPVLQLSTFYVDDAHACQLRPGLQIVCMPWSNFNATAVDGQ